jgi:protein-disulfide isomerase
MATRAEEKERLRDRRLELEEREEQQTRRKLLLGGGIALLAICVVAALILISQSGDKGGDSAVEGVDEVSAQLEGIPQRGHFLGAAGARVTVVEFGDLQCPVCKEYSTSVVAPLIAGAVREERAKLEFRHWAIVGPQSRDAAAAAYAAAEQNRYWSFIELYYDNQGIENSGYVTDEFLRSIAEGAGVPDLARWEKDRSADRWSAALAKAEDQAAGFGFTGTPSFLVIGPNGTQAVGTPHSTADIEAAISRAS